MPKGLRRQAGSHSRSPRWAGLEHKEYVSKSVKMQGELTLLKPHYCYVCFINIASFYPYITVLGARLSCPGF